VLDAVIRDALDAAALAALVVLREAPAGHQAKRERGNGQVRRVGFRIVAGLVSDQHPDATFAGAPCQ